MKKAILFVFSVLVSNLAMAEEFWTAPVKISELSTFYTSGNNHIVIKGATTFTKEDGSAIPFCAKTASENVVGTWTSSSISNTLSAYYASAMNAKNLDLEIKIYLRSSDCSSRAGMRMRGIKFID